MSEQTRKFLVAKRQHSFSRTISPSRQWSVTAQNVSEANIEENDDEAERLAQREHIECPVSTIIGSEKRQPFRLPAISNVNVAEMNVQIAQCLKLSAEDKINDKNAFQLKMIDFLVYALKKQDPSMTNLQMASASLDASAKIYGFRVDKVHSELLKIIGMVKQDKKDHQEENNDSQDSNHSYLNVNEVMQKKKKKKNRQHIISTVEALKGNVETYNPLFLIKGQRDIQTSDMLFQAGLPQHANQGVALNLYNDVVLDKVAQNNTGKPVKISICNIENYIALDICVSYATFRFLDWSPDVESEEPKSQIEEVDGKYHFDLNATASNEVLENDIRMDCGDVYEEVSEHSAQNNQNFENIVDFQDTIANNPNPNATYEYSYVHKNKKIRLAGSSHWKIIHNKNLQGSRATEAGKQSKKKKKKDIELSYTIDSKEERKIKFIQNNKQPKVSKVLWSEDKVTFPESMYYDLKRYNIFYSKATEHLKLSYNKIMDKLPSRNDKDLSNCNDDDDDLPNFVEQDEGYCGDNSNNERFTQNASFTQENSDCQSQTAFVGDNLVSVPKLTDKVFIPYPQKAKKIDMRQLKKIMWENLTKSSKTADVDDVDVTQACDQQENEHNKRVGSKVFSDVYLELPKMLAKTNADTLSPALAFLSLLHLANENNLNIQRDSIASDLSIKDGRNETDEM